MSFTVHEIHLIHLSSLRTKWKPHWCQWKHYWSFWYIWDQELLHMFNLICNFPSLQRHFSLLLISEVPLLKDKIIYLLCSCRKPDSWFICSHLFHWCFILQKLIYSHHHLLITLGKSYCFLIMFFYLCSEQGIFSGKASEFFSGGCILCSMWLYVLSKFATAIQALSDC